eukprot:2163635-Ditylum_brightwellii.AAC.1
MVEECGQRDDQKGVLWRKLVASSEKCQTLHSGQFGGRQDKDAQILTLIEELKYDISYTSRKGVINFDNDAASCYDRIIPGLASLIARKKVKLLIIIVRLSPSTLKHMVPLFTTPDKETSVSLSMVGFVDDSQGN